MHDKGCDTDGHGSNNEKRKTVNHEDGALPEGIELFGSSGRHQVQELALPAVQRDIHELEHIAMV